MNNQAVSKIPGEYVHNFKVVTDKAENPYA